MLKKQNIWKKIIVAVVFMLSILSMNNASVEAVQQGDFVQDNGRIYFEIGGEKVTYWQKIDDSYYYFGTDGKMVIGWQFIPDPYAQLTVNISNNTTQIEGLTFGWYYFNQNGVLLNTSGMQLIEKRSQSNTGKLFGDRYEFNAQKEWYYIKPNFSLHTGWLKEGKDWYYMKEFDETPIRLVEAGERLHGWFQDEDYKIYYLNEQTGKMTTGWLKYQDDWYYFHGHGEMATGWLKYDNNWYYLSEDGAMKTGWYTVANKWYYSYSTGKLAVNTVVDGYRLNHNGEWIK